MANRLQADEIRWILSLDAKGVQSELATISSKVDDLTNKNKELATDLKLVEKLMKESEKEMQRLERRGDTTSVAYQRASASFSQLSADAESLRTEIGQNTQQIDAFVEQSRRMINTTQVQNLTMNQLRQRSRELQIQLDETSEAADPDVYRQLANELSTVNRRMEELGGGSRSMFSVFKGGLAVFAGNMMTQAVDKVKELVNQAKEFVVNGIEMAKSAEGVVIAFGKLNNSKYHLDEMRKSTQGTISDLKLMEKAVRADEMGIGISNMAKLLQFAQQQAKVMKTDVDYMANSIVDGIGRKSTLVLDNLGLSAVQVQNEVKKTGDFTAGVLKIVNDRLKEQGNEALTGSEKAEKAAAKWENAQLKVGQKLQWLGLTWDTISGKIADGIANLAGETRNTNEIFDDQLELVAKLKVETSPLIDQYEKMSRTVKLNYDQTKELNPEQKQLLSLINQIREAIPGVVTEFDKYGRAIGINTDKARDFIKTQIAMLKYMNKDAIKDTEEDIDKYTKAINKLKENKDSGGYSYSVGGGNYGGGGTQVQKKYSPLEIEEIDKQISQLELLRTGAEERLQQINGVALEDQQTNYEERLVQQNKFNEMNKKQLDIWIKDVFNADSKYMELAKSTYKSRFGGNDGSDSGSGSKTDQVLLQEKKKLADMLEKLEIVRTQKLADINKDYLDGKIKTEAEYNRKIYAAEQSFLTMRETSLNSFIETSKRVETKQDATKQLATVQEKMLAQQIKYQKEVEKILLDANPLEKEKQAYTERLDALGLYGKTTAALQLDIAAAETEQEKEELQKKLEAFLILEKQYQENVDKIKKSDKAKDKANAETLFNDGDGTEANQGFKKRKEELQTELNDLQNIAAANPTFDAEMAVHLQRLAMIQEEIDARRAAGLETTNQIKEQGKIEAEMSSSVRKELEKRAAQFQQYGNTVGQALGNVMTGQETALKAFGDASVDIVFDILQKIIEAELVKVMAASTSAIMRATAEAMSTPQSALTFGASGFATAAILTGAISAATMVAKTALKGLLNKKSGSSSSSTSSDSSRSGSMTVKQRAKGKYDVVGQDDGQLYKNVPYMGEAKTGIVSRPTLMGERGSELVVSAPDFLSLRKHVNYPLVVQAIQDARFGRVPQRAEGKYNNIESTQTNQIQPTLESSVLRALTDAIDAFNNKKLNLGMTELQAEMNKMNETNKRYTRKS